MIRYALILLFVAARSAHSRNNSICEQKRISLDYIDTAVDTLVKTKYYISTRLECANVRDQKPLDCADILHMGFNESGIYKIWPRNRLTEHMHIEVYCDMDTDGGGWTVIQRRGNFRSPVDYFFQGWKSYKEGFGDLQKDFWLGNDYIFAITNTKVYSARFDLQDVQLVRRYAQYETFWIDDENQKYTLHISGYRGDAGDSMSSAGNNNHNNQKFSTKDWDNDNNGRSCAQAHKGGWWYNNCHQANLNGLYLRGIHQSHADGVNWLTWRGYKESLEATEIKIRPKSFRFPDFSASISM